MSSDKGLVGHVPYLRRFARALTGSQVTGDACVVAALEDVLADKSSNVPARIALYRSVLAKVNALDAIPISATASQSADLEAVQRNLAVLTPVGRQAFLLVAMEGFSLEETAQVLEMSTDEVESLLEDANQDIASQIATDVVIIEDEPLIAMDLQVLVQGLGHRVVRVARTERQAIEAVRQTRPGLVLADIQLADGSSGLDAVNEILPLHSVPVIFITAFPERLLTGTKPVPAGQRLGCDQPSAVLRYPQQAGVIGPSSDMRAYLALAAGEQLLALLRFRLPAVGVLGGAPGEVRLPAHAPLGAREAALALLVALLLLERGVRVPVAVGRLSGCGGRCGHEG